MSSDSVNKKDHSLVLMKPLMPSTLSVGTSDSPVAGEKGPKRINGLKEMEEDDILSDDSFLRRKERTGMPQHIRALGIRPAWWKEKKKEKLCRDIRLARARLNVWDLPAQSAKEPLQLPFDIAACILSHIPDLETLSDSILINKTFSSSFEAFRLGITRDVVGNMFGLELVEYVLILAGMLAHKGPLKDKNGKISLIPPAPTTTLSSSVLREIIKVWHTTNVWIGLWETDRSWSEEHELVLTQLSSEALTDKSRIYFVQVIIMFWIYSTCARNTLHHGRHGGCSMRTLENTGIFDYYSHIELLGVRAIFNYFESRVYTVCDDSGLEGDDHYLYWQSYCVSLGPLWILKLLDHYDSGFEEAGDGQDEGFFFYHPEVEQEAREIDGMYFGLTEKSIKKIHKQFTGMRVDGVARPIDQPAKG